MPRRLLRPPPVPRDLDLQLARIEALHRRIEVLCAELLVLVNAVEGVTGTPLEWPL